jgi:cyclin-dependent kinase 12/13
MGCVQARPSTYSPHGQGIEKLKLDGGYVKGGRERIPITRSLAHLEEYSLKDIRKLEDKHVVGVRLAEEGRVVLSEAERERSSGSQNVSRRVESAKKIGEDELVDGWPKWLVDNVPGDLLEGLVAKSADSYDKLDKVSVDIT